MGARHLHTLGLGEDVWTVAVQEKGEDYVFWIDFDGNGRVSSDERGGAAEAEPQGRLGGLSTPSCAR